ncbi:prickle-like protein 4 isoform X8 [Cavia porcellus]|uniref:prickle-like protein 4 isoform X8 n=1 Tax=Cavia porcellus TaxID=10141 RepID=UPI002FE3C5F7
MVPAAPRMYPSLQDTSLPASWPGVWTLLQQLPPQDSDERYYLALGEEELVELRLFCAQRKQKALGQGVAHLVPPELKGDTCEKLIFSQRYTEAEGRHWHENHFCCQDCSGPLSGGRYALTGGSPCCPRCFKSRYPDTGSSPQRAPEGWASPGAPGPDRSRGSAQALGRAVAQVPRSSPDILRGRVRPNASRDPEERTPCPTCSSSSDSEPEGFFLGRRLLRPRKIPEDSAASEKRCSVC